MRLNIAHPLKVVSFNSHPRPDTIEDLAAGRQLQVSAALNFVCESMVTRTWCMNVSERIRASGPEHGHEIAVRSEAS